MEGNEALEREKIVKMNIKLDSHIYLNDSKTPFGNHRKPSSELTLYDIDGEGLGCPLHSVDLGCADIVSIAAGLEAVDENTTVAVNCEVHPWWYGGTIIHAETEVCGFWIGQQAG